MSFALLFDADLTVQIHAFCTMAAFVLGLVQFALPKGSPRHLLCGYAKWLARPDQTLTLASALLTSLPYRLSPALADGGAKIGPQ